MMRMLGIIILTALIPTLASAENLNCSTLDQILGQAQFSDLTNAQKQESRESVNWSKSKQLMAFCFDKQCFVVKPCETPNVIVDISHAVSGNLGKIGWRPQYDKIENRPVFTSENRHEVLAKWNKSEFTPTQEPDEPDTYGTLIQTRIWKDGQRYTVYEPLLVVNNKPFYR